jgi:hypothetical protein
MSTAGRHVPGAGGVRRQGIKVAHHSRVLVLRGEAGIGKTALMEYLARIGSGCRVLRAAGVESEMELAFAGAHQLCAPGRHGRAERHAPRLAQPQRHHRPPRCSDGGCQPLEGAARIGRWAACRATLSGCARRRATGVDRRTHPRRATRTRPAVRYRAAARPTIGTTSRRRPGSAASGASNRTDPRRPRGSSGSRGSAGPQRADRQHRVVGEDSKRRVALLVHLLSLVSLLVDGHALIRPARGRAR